MIVEKSMSSNWLSNTWLVADEPGGKAVLVDTGGPAKPILARIEELGLELTHILCTHHHVDHVANNGAFKKAYGCPVCGGKEERALFASLAGGLDVELSDGDEIVTGDLHVRALHIPGHTLGQLGFVVNDERVFTGDTLFKGSVGGTRAPGHTTFEDLRHSIMDVLMALPKETDVHPGHTEPTTIGREWDENPFIRVWRGVDRAHEAPCTAFGKPARLLLRAGDYDGGTKCLVRFDDGDVVDVVPGSQVREV
jgi:glyoxylase-like metal-dependent hydrolase (beta-lactamase superfamily II)